MTALYRLVALFAFSIDIPVSTAVGAGLAIHHGFGIVVHNRARLGNGVTLRQAVTIGAKEGGEPPVIGDGVSVGAGAHLIGDITVGAGAVIGAGAVVLKDVAAATIVAGNPARQIKANQAE